ncbi:hypothetical protein NB717_003664 [Xanthomonas sacchari]|nr:hypothetical protein [Xanthomonas sacchari]
MPLLLDKQSPIVVGVRDPAQLGINFIDDPALGIILIGMVLHTGYAFDAPLEITHRLRRSTFGCDHLYRVDGIVIHVGRDIPHRIGLSSDPRQAVVGNGGSRTNTIDDIACRNFAPQPIIGVCYCMPTRIDLGYFSSKRVILVSFRQVKFVGACILNFTSDHSSLVIGIGCRRRQCRTRALLDTGNFTKLIVFIFSDGTVYFSNRGVNTWRACKKMTSSIVGRHHRDVSPVLHTTRPDRLYCCNSTFRSSRRIPGNGIQVACSVIQFTERIICKLGHLT